MSHTRPLLVILIVLTFVTVPAWAQNGWEKKWNAILAAARKEGRVVVKGPHDQQIRQNLPAAFTAKFGIPVEYIGGRSSQIAARVRAERRARVYTVDIFLSGVQSTSTILYQEKMLDPLKPVLVLPEVIDPSKWKKGKLWFMDPQEKYALRLLSNAGGNIYINTKHVDPGELRKGRDLLNPKWKGKITVDDPTVPGKGMGTATWLYVQFGDEFIKKFYIDQKPVLSRSGRQMVDWLARGTYPISFGADRVGVEQLQKEGFPLRPAKLSDLQPRVSPGGAGLISLVNNAPHPNAAAVFINWMASREGLEVYARAAEYSPLRKDIDESFLTADVIPRPDVSYFDADWQFVVTEQERVRRHLKKILSGRRR